MYIYIYIDREREREREQKTLCVRERETWSIWIVAAVPKISAKESQTSI